MLLNYHLTGKEPFIQFTARVFRELSTIYVCVSIPFNSDGGIWDVLLCQTGYIMKILLLLAVLLFYVHGKHLWSCRDGQLT